MFNRQQICKRLNPSSSGSHLNLGPRTWVRSQRPPKTRQNHLIAEKEKWSIAITLTDNKPIDTD